MIIEDVMAVDTGVGRAYRKAIDERYKASAMFRSMLHQLNLFWAIPALLVGAGVTAAVVDNRVPQTIAYGIGRVMAAICGRKSVLIIRQDGACLHFGSAYGCWSRYNGCKLL